MASFSFDTVIFDLDGTLADTAFDLAAALNHALTRMGREAVPTPSVQRLIGHGARALLRRGLAATGEANEDLVEQGMPLFLDFYATNICVGTKIYPDLESALDALRARGLRIGICTNKLESLTMKLVEALGWQDRFDAIVCGDTLPVRKPDPAPLREAIARAGGQSGILVGDSITDADTARAAGLPFVAVSFGFSDRPVDQLGADVVIHGYVDLVPALQKLER
ncbi:phosphoglycolate phosphatase [Sphingosinicella rhizophila]|uniref:Phosphoglycolate phosphatase n=1 Tax=Sphingosinicella rhizophila TaxID=3050082 RepID=A0ABU3Q637_9SPHN|nr:phosphoglycolate phosphatase [Sphingosinicella sp. GR2756]MDT9598438.1 phosphoglycolate phosphatase [Sphingosinicella sp. GR2756]